MFLSDFLQRHHENLAKLIDLVSIFNRIGVARAGLQTLLLLIN